MSKTNSIADNSIEEKDAIHANLASSKSVSPSAAAAAAAAAKSKARTREEVPMEPESWYEAYKMDFEDEKPGDDMLFYVRFDIHRRPAEERVFLRRWTASDKPSLYVSPEVDWRSTYYLNMIVNHFQYRLDFKVYRKEFTSKGNPRYIVLRKHSQPIYAAPNHVDPSAHSNKQVVECTYPDIFFTLHDHDMTADSNPPVSKSDEYIAVNLEATGKFFGNDVENVELFRGAAAFDVVFQAYTGMKTSSKHKHNRKKHTGVYLSLRGPRGKGKAQMSVVTQSQLEKSRTDKEKGVDEHTHSGGLTGAVGSLFGWSKTKTIEKEPLYCSLTYCSLPWEAIVADLDRAWMKKMAL